MYIKQLSDEVVRVIDEITGLVAIARVCHVASVFAGNK